MKLGIISEPAIENFRALNKLLKELKLDITEVYVAEGRGLSSCATSWAATYPIPVVKIQLNRRRYGQHATKYQGDALVREIDALVLVWDGRNPFGRQLKYLARAQGKRLYLVDLDFQV